MRRDGEIHSVGQPLDGPLQLAVLKGAHFPAALAHDVVVVLSTGVNGLVARHTLGSVDASRQSKGVKEVEGSVDRGDPDLVTPLV